MPIRIQRRPSKDPLAASAVSFMNPNQDNLVICRKPYVNYPGLKDAKPSIIALCKLPHFEPNYAKKHYLSPIALLQVNFSSTTDV